MDDYMTRPPIKTIGLRKYLDDKSERHQGFDYIAFVKLVESSVSAGNIAKAFGVSRPTVYHWIEVYKDQDNDTNIDWPDEL